MSHLIKHRRQRFDALHALLTAEVGPAPAAMAPDHAPHGTHPQRAPKGAITWPAALQPLARLFPHQS